MTIVCFYLREIFRAIYSLSEGKSWRWKEAKRLMEEKYFDDWMEKRCSMDWQSFKVWFQRGWGPFLHKEYIIKFSRHNEQLWDSWKAAVFTKNTLYKNWDLSLFWHGLTALAGFCMNSSYMSAYVYLESKGITQIEGEMKKSSNFHAWSRQTNELRKTH